MQPSSLIFLVIIAIWAAYLLQHWVRRREHLATARSVDRFSEAMRVLTRPEPRTETAPAAAARPYLTSPARQSRPEVVVKRAVVTLPKASAGSEPAAPSRARPAAVRPTRLFRALGAMTGISARRLRGLTLLVALVAVPTLVGLAAVRVVPWWAAGAAGAVLVLDLAVLRTVARRGRAARRQARDAARMHHRSGPTAASRGATGRTAGDGHGIPAGARTDRPAHGAPAKASATEVAGADRIGWQPVPVPPPTYTLKAKAEPATAPAATRPALDDLDLEDTQEMPVRVADWDDLVDPEEIGELLERRSATGA